jgi:hypothetical protein
MITPPLGCSAVPSPKKKLKIGSTAAGLVAAAATATDFVCTVRLFDGAATVGAVFGSVSALPSALAGADADVDEGAGVAAVCFDVPPEPPDEETALDGLALGFSCEVAACLVDFAEPAVVEECVLLDEFVGPASLVADGPPVSAVAAGAATIAAPTPSANADAPIQPNTLAPPNAPSPNSTRLNFSPFLAARCRPERAESDRFWATSIATAELMAFSPDGCGHGRWASEPVNRAANNSIGLINARVRISIQIDGRVTALAPPVAVQRRLLALASSLAAKDVGFQRS